MREKRFVMGDVMKLLTSGKLQPSQDINLASFGRQKPRDIFNSSFFFFFLAIRYNNPSSKFLVEKKKNNVL